MATTPIYGFTLPTVGGSSGTWGTINNALHDDWDTVIGLPRVVCATATIGATTTLDLSTANVFTLTISQITTMAFANVPSGAFASRVTLLLTNPGAFAVTWPPSVIWMLNGTAPIFPATGIAVVELVTPNNGTTWYGFFGWGGLGSGLIPKRQTLATNSADFQTGVSNGNYLLTFDTNAASDVGGLHSTSVNPSRIVIPTGWEGGGILLTAGCVVLGLSTPTTDPAVQLYISKNGAGGSAARAIQTAPNNGTQTSFDLSTSYFDPAPVVTDYYTAQVTIAGSGNPNLISIKTGNSAFFSGVQVY